MSRSSTAAVGDPRQADYAGQIRREALASGAKSLRLCSQAYGELQALIKGEGQGGGICRSLSIAWLADRKRGLNLLDRLLGPGGSVKTGVVLPMCLAYKAKGAMNRLGERAYIAAELIAAGLSHTGTDASEAAKLAAGVGVWYFMLQSSALSGVGQLRMVNIRDGYDHAMAMDLRDATCPMFFDPNWGEFSFPTTAHLANFLLTSMFVKQGTETLYANKVAIHNVEKICFS